MSSLINDVIIKKLSYDTIRKLYKQHNHEFVENQYVLNIFGIRKNNELTDLFDDVFGVAYVDQRNIAQLIFFAGTTDPGSTHYKNPKNAKGVAIVKPGQYKRLWKLGLHKKIHRAFVQQNPITVYRDKNKDNQINTNVTDTGLFGINLHPHLQGKILAALNIGGSSAGCQVPQDVSDFKKLYELGKLQTKMTGVKSFHYTLFEANSIATFLKGTETPKPTEPVAVITGITTTGTTITTGPASLS